MSTTPIGVGDVALGEIGWALIRGAIYATMFLLVMFVLGFVQSPLAILALPAAILIGFAFAGVGMAATTFMRTWQDMDMVQMVILPLFLFSATFYPLDTYPDGVRVLVQLTPLYHGVDLIRSLTTGIVGPGIFVHIAYLLIMGLVGLAITSRRLERLLLK
jgi:lipooligosaccharide transport system permease protein